MPSRKLQPALLGGIFIGAFSALPVVSIGNVCCCLWLVSGGVLAAWLLQQNHPDSITPANGAAVGFLAGVIGAVVFLIISWPLSLAMGPLMDEWMERAMEGAGDVPWRDVFERYRGAGTRTMSLVLGFCLHLILGMIFAPIGGLLGAMLFRKPPVVPPPPPLPPPPAAWTPPPPPTLPIPPPSNQGGDSA